MPMPSLDLDGTETILVLSGQPSAISMLTRITLWLGGLGFVGFGLAFLVAPHETLGLLDLQLNGPHAATELRAFYGGLEIGVGLCLIGADLRGWQRPGLLLCLAAYGGISLARVLGIALAGGASGALWIALALEFGIALLAAVALWRHDDALVAGQR
jgi:hypothetical protein